MHPLLVAVVVVWEAMDQVQQLQELEEMVDPALPIHLAGLLIHLEAVVLEAAMPQAELLQMVAAVAEGRRDRQVDLEQQTQVVVVVHPQIVLESQVELVALEL